MYTYDEKKYVYVYIYSWHLAGGQELRWLMRDAVNICKPMRKTCCVALHTPPTYEEDVERCVCIYIYQKGA